MKLLPKLSLQSLTDLGLWAACAIFSLGLAALSGCSGKSSLDEKPNTPAPVVEKKPADDVTPKRGKLISESVETDRFNNGVIRRQRHVRRYDGDVVVNHGSYAEFYPDDRPFISGQYDDDKRVGDWSFWYKNGQLVRKEHYEQGKLEGAWSIYREDGTKSDDVSYHDNKKNGHWVEYDATGKQPTSEMDLRDGVLQGTRIEYFPSGKKQAEGNFTDGKLDGPLTEWYPTGKKKKETNFKMGAKNGKEIDFNEEGKPIYEKEYRDGKLVPTKKPS